MPGDATTRLEAAVRTALASRRSIDVVGALASIDPDELHRFFHAGFLDEFDGSPVAVGLPASPGVASGRIVLSAEAAIDADEPVILVRPHTTPDDVAGMQAAAGIVTSRGGQASHAAVVARGWGTPAVVGVSGITFEADRLVIDGVTCSQGDHLAIDGGTGEIFVGRREAAVSEPPAELGVLLGWADAVNAGRVEIRVNADTAPDAALGCELGATGVGLCRTEHMFLSADRLPSMRRFILSEDADDEAAALAELEDHQVVDFEALLEVMGGKPITIRLLDPPLHEFLPDLLELVARDARGDLDESEQAELAVVRRLHEVNPMIGTRGVRLGMLRDGLYEMQVRAICRAVSTALDRGWRPHVEIMIPLVVDAEELRIAREWVAHAMEQTHSRLGSNVVTVGAMIETPRAALTAEGLAAHADFFSFGTNDMTQLTFGFSRDDVESKLLPTYQSRGVLESNPFTTLDYDGVGELIRLGCLGARAAKPGMKLGVCGEHAGDVSSVAMLLEAGVDALSCSPFRVPLARLAAAQALIALGRVDPALEIDFPGPSTDGDGSVARPAERESTESVAGAGALPVDESLLLHVIRIRGVVTAQALMDSLGSHPEDALMSLIDLGHVRHIEARGMYMLLPEGRARHEALLALVVDEPTQLGLREAYADFLTLNGEFKQLCTRWQMRGDVANDHTDAGYDEDCLEQLQRIRDQAIPIIDAMAKMLPRLSRYRHRLGSATDRALSGDVQAFTGVGCGSVHDIWMELHEDLLVLLGIDREHEGSF